MLPPNLYYRAIRYRIRLEEALTGEGNTMGIERRRARSSNHDGDDADADSDIELDDNPEASLYAAETENASAPLFGHARLVHMRGDDAGMAHLAGTLKPVMPVYVTIHR